MAQFPNKTQSIKSIILKKTYSYVDRLPTAFKEKWAIKFLGWWKIPMIHAVDPKVITFSQVYDHEKYTALVIPFTRFNKNHLGSLYFGSFAVGADLCGGLYPLKWMMEHKKVLSLAFKNFSIQFLKRAYGDVIFVHSQNQHIANLIQTVHSSGQRQNLTLEIQAFTLGTHSLVTTFEDFWKIYTDKDNQNHLSLVKEIQCAEMTITLSLK
jgi:hypothetical protein